MSINTDKLNFSNFFHYYLFNPLSKNLNKNDRIKALVGTICLGFTLGAGHAFCRLFFYDKNLFVGKKNQGSEKTSRVVKETFTPKSSDVNNLAKPKVEVPIKKSEETEPKKEPVEEEAKKESIKEKEVELKELSEAEKNFEKIRKRLEKKAAYEKGFRELEKIREKVQGEKEEQKLKEREEFAAQKFQNWASERKKVEQFLNMSEELKQLKCENSSVQELYKLQQMIYNDGHNYCLLNCFSEAKMRSLKVKSGKFDPNFFKSGKEKAQFDEIFPKISTSEEVKTSKIRLLSADQIFGLWDYFDANRAACISMEQVKSLNIKDLSDKTHWGDRSKFQELFKIKGPFAEQARERLQALDPKKQLIYVINELGQAEFDAITDEQFQGLDFSFVGDDVLHQFFPRSSDSKNVFNLKDIGLRRLELLSFEQFKQMKIKSSRMPDLENFIKNKFTE